MTGFSFQVSPVRLGLFAWVTVRVCSVVSEATALSFLEDRRFVNLPPDLGEAQKKVYVSEKQRLEPSITNVT